MAEDKDSEFDIDEALPKYDVDIKKPNKCNRYIGVEIDNVYVKKSLSLNQVCKAEQQNASRIRIEDAEGRLYGRANAV